MYLPLHVPKRIYKAAWNKEINATSQRPFDTRNYNLHLPAAQPILGSANGLLISQRQKWSQPPSTHPGPVR